LKYLSTTILSKKLGLTSRELFSEFEKRGWITTERTLTVEGFSVGGIYKEIEKKGKTIKYIAWPEDIQIGIEAQTISYITVSKLGQFFELSSLKINYILAEIGWSKKGEFNKGWLATDRGLAIGAVQTEDIKSGIPYIRWPENIIKNSILTETIADFKGSPRTECYDINIQNYRKRFISKYRTTSGFMTRSKSEALISNWLYMLEIAHAYERKLPIEEEAYACFYIPRGKVYIEYFGCDVDQDFGYDKNCQERRGKKLAYYEKYELNIIELTSKDILKLDDILPKLLLKYGIQTY